MALVWRAGAPPLRGSNAVPGQPQRAVEESDDLAIDHLVERVAIEAVRVSRALTGEDLQRSGEAGYEGKVPGTLDENVFHLRQRPCQPFGMIPHARQVVFLRSIDEHGNRDLRQRIVGEGRRVRRHEHDGPYPRIAELRDVADLAGSFPSGSPTVVAELG